jgi:hypothetical protein
MEGSSDTASYTLIEGGINPSSSSSSSSSSDAAAAPTLKGTAGIPNSIGSILTYVFGVLVSIFTSNYVPFFIGDGEADVRVNVVLGCLVAMVVLWYEPMKRLLCLIVDARSTHWNNTIISFLDCMTLVILIFSSQYAALTGFKYMWRMGFSPVENAVFPLMVLLGLFAAYQRIANVDPEIEWVLAQLGPGPLSRDDFPRACALFIARERQGIAK